MEQRSTLADKLLESLARNRDEGLLTDEEYASRVEQLVRVSTPAAAEPVPEVASEPPLVDGASPVTDEDEDSALDLPVTTPPPVEQDQPSPAPRAESPESPVERPVHPAVAASRNGIQKRQAEPAETSIAPLALVADPAPVPEGSETGDGGAEAQDAQPPQARRRRFTRRAKALAIAEAQVPAPPAAAPPAVGGMSEERLAELKDTLREIEMEGWQAVVEYRACGFYSNQLTDDGLLILPDGSVLDKWEAAVSALNGDETWTSYRIEDERLVLLSAGCAALTYTASAQMLDEPEYRAVITSVFVRRGDEWLIALRQETPVQPFDNPS